MNIGINDKLDALISLTAKECGNDDVEMFNNLDTSKVSLDKRFYLKLRQIISKYKRTTVVLTFKKFLVRVAVALMALMSLGFLTIMATPDLREAIFEAVVEWYENYISIRYEPVADDTHGTDTTYESIDSTFVASSENESNVPVVVPPTKIENVMKPAYIPKDLEEEVVKSDISGLVIDYYKGNDLCYTYYQTVLNGHDKLFDNKNAKISEITINETIATLIEYNNSDDKNIVWNDGLYFYHIQVFESFISIEELLKIAESVQ
jgi:hypothetical protein